MQDKLSFFLDIKAYVIYVFQLLNKILFGTLLPHLISLTSHDLTLLAGKYFLRT